MDKKMNSNTRHEKNLNSTRTIYVYDFNGRFVDKFKSPTDVAKKLLGVHGRSIAENAHKIASLRSEITTSARNNTDTTNGAMFVYGYAPSYREMTAKEVTSHRKTRDTRGSKVLQYDFNGNLMNIYENAADASEKLGKSTTWISILCNANFILRYDR